jgi:NADPH2:quinone reductase
VRALVLTALEGPAALELRDVPEPERADGTVLIDVHAAGVSFPDLLLTRGQYQLKAEPPFVPGVEVAGVVRSAPEDAAVAAGDRVFAQTGLGGFAEAALAPAALTFPLPERLSFAQGAGMLMNHHTAVFALARRGRLAEGETVLVHGAAGGVGSAAVQVARGLGAGRVIAVVSSEAKAEVARAAGAHDTVLAGDEWATGARELAGGRGADVIFDPVGGERLGQSLRALAPEGRLLVVGFAEGSIPQIAANRILLRNVDVVGVNWGGFLAVDPAAVVQEAATIARLIASGHIDPVVGSQHQLEDGAAALREIEERRATGKVVLSVR